MSGRGDDWSATEVDLTVADYFAMLRAEMLGTPYSKAGHRAALRPQLAGRSDGSVEFKHQNISAVLVHLGLPYVDGYKPRGNYQSLLERSVRAYLDADPGLLEEVAGSPRLDPPVVGLAPVDALFEPPPERIARPEERPAVTWRSRRGRRIDFAARDAANRRLGRLGEQFVVDVERRRLTERGRDDLAGRVEWVAETRGDGLGFDVLSFDERDESERLVEVKTTGLGRFFPFYVTRAEVACSETAAAEYRLYRVFDFGQRPRLYTLAGPLSAVLRLDPVQYRASL